MGDGPIDYDGDQIGAEDTDMADSEAEDTVKFEGFEDFDDDEGDDVDDEQDWEEKQVGKVYERTIGALGDVLGGPPIGIITEE